MRYQAADLELAEQRFREGIWSCVPDVAMLECGVQARWFGPILATVFAELPDAIELNAIQGATEPGAVADGHLDEAVEWMHAWEVDYQVPVAAGRPGTGLAETWLHWHGCEQSAVMRKYVRPASRLPWRDAPGVEVRELPPVPDEGLDCMLTPGLELPFLAGTLFVGLPCQPGWRCYFASVDDVTMACGSMRIENGIAMLGLDVTMSEGRRRGCHSALLRRRLDDAVAAGCQTVFTVLPDDPTRGGSAASRNFRRAGFAEAYREVVWRPPAEISVV